MEIWQMRYFIQLCNDLSFNKAARNLFISQQGLSSAIKKMEDEFQITLLERTSKGVKPTIYGEILLEKSHEIINNYDELVNRLNNSIHQKNKTIYIGLTNSIYTDYLKSILYEFQEINSEITLEFIELGYYTCIKNLENNLIDICFTIKPDNPYQFNFISLSTYELVLLSNKQNNISTKSNLKMIDLKNEKFIMLSSDSKIRKLIVETCSQSGFTPNIIITTSAIDFIFELVDLNKGISILPDFNSEKAKKMSNNIAISSLKNCSLKVEVGFVTNRYKKMNFFTKVLIEHLLMRLNT